MEQIILEAYNEIEKFIKSWPIKYTYHIKQEGMEHNSLKFMSEFSVPIKNKPIPLASVKVYFYYNPYEKDENSKICFKFENDQLKHTPNKTIRISQIDKWLDKILEKKLQTSQVLFLGTEFEATRLRDDKNDEFIKPEEKRQIILQEYYVDPELLTDQYSELDQFQKNVDYKSLNEIKQSLFSLFRIVDKEDMGTLCYSEFQEVLQSMNLDFSEEDMNYIFTKIDTDKTGLIEYREFVPIGAEVLQGLKIKKKIEEETISKEEEIYDHAVLIFLNDQIHNFAKEVIKQCKEKDEQSEGFFDLEQIKDACNEACKKYSENLKEEENKMKIEIEKNPKKSEKIQMKFKQMQQIPFESNEIPEFIQYLQKTIRSTIPYSKMGEYLLKFKVEKVKYGLMEASINKLEKYLRDIFQKEDTDNTGLISISTLKSVLQNQNKIILTKIHMYMITSFLEKEENSDTIRYQKNSRLIAGLIKNLIDPIKIEKRLSYIQAGGVRFNELMDDWNPITLKNELDTLFYKYDLDKNNLLDREEYIKLLKSTKVRFTEDEITQLIDKADVNKDGLLSYQEFAMHYYDLLKKIRRAKILESLNFK